jgi:hypothetical protein
MEKVVTIKKLHDKGNDFLFWKNKSELERLEAIELLRLQYIKYIFKDVQPRFQRVCSIINRK